MSVEAIDPHTFPMSWHKQCWDKYVTAQTTNKLPHAMLITGEEGIGKTFFAERITQSLLCTNRQNSEACGECQSCKTYKAESNPDFLKIDLLEEKQQISVDQIRAMNEFINYSRSFEAYRVILINKVDRLNINAANSLLKSLEEPSRNTVIILISSQFSRLLPTIKSRCQRLHIPTPSKSETMDWLNKLSIDIDAENSQNIKPLTLLNKEKNELNKHIEYFEDIHQLINQDKNLLQIAKKWDKTIPLSDLVDWQLFLLQQLIKQKSIESTTTKSKLFNTLQNYFDTNSLWRIYQETLKQKHYIHTSVNSLMFIENVLLLWKINKNS